ISLEEWSQCGMPTGAPLYPWLRILPSWTISAPTESREQVALWDQAHATCIRTSISLGRSDMTHDLLDPKWDGTPTRASTEDAQVGVPSRELMWSSRSCLHEQGSDADPPLEDTEKCSITTHSLLKRRVSDRGQILGASFLLDDEDSPDILGLTDDVGARHG